MNLGMSVFYSSFPQKERVKKWGAGLTATQTI
jgi:hypothetical protein